MIFQLTYDYPAFITLGVLVVAVYGIWLRLAVRQGPAVWVLVAEAIIAALFAAAFWWGAAYVLLNAFGGTDLRREMGQMTLPCQGHFRYSASRVILYCFYPVIIQRE